MKKRGLSPVVASILMILLVLFLAIMIFLWARGFIGEQVEKFGKPIEAVCSQVDFEAEIVSGSGLNILEIVNRGDVDIFYFNVKKVSGGVSEMEKFSFPVDAGKSLSGEDIDLRMSDGVVPEEIVVYPALVGSVSGASSNQVFTCIDYGQTLVF